MLTDADPNVLEFPIAVGGTATRSADYVFGTASGGSDGVTVRNVVGTADLVVRVDRDVLGESFRGTLPLLVRMTADSDSSESDETVVLRVSGGALTLALIEAPASVEVKFTQASSQVIEGEAAAQLVLALDAATGRDLRFPLTYPTAGSTATEGADYTQRSVYTILANGRTRQVLPIKVTHDTVDEPNETFTVALGTAPSGATKSTPDAATVTILDNDPTTVKLGLAGAGALKEGTSTRVTVTLGRELVTGEQVTVPLTVTGVDTSDYTLTLASGSGVNTGVTLNTANPYSAAKPAVIFGVGAQVATLILTAEDDGVEELAEPLRVRFRQHVEAGASFKVVSNLDQRGLSIIGARGTAVPADNADGGSVRVTIGAAALDLTIDKNRVTEGELVSVTVTRSQRNGSGADIKIPVRFTSAGTPFIAASEFTVDVVFPDGSQSAAASLKAPNDRADEPTEQYTVELGNVLPEGHEPGTQTSASFTVVDNDPTTVTLTGDSGNVAEGGRKTFTVTLSRRLAQGEALSVPLVFAGTAKRDVDYRIVCPDLVPQGVRCSNSRLNTADNPSVMFTGYGPSSTDTVPVTLTLTARKDTTPEPFETVDIRLGVLNTSSGSGLGGGATGVDSFAAFSIADTEAELPTLPTPKAEPEQVLETASSPVDVYTVPASLIADVSRWAAETRNGTAHVKRWKRVLLAFGETVPGFTGTPITLAEAQQNARTFWRVRWDPIVTALQELAANPTLPAQTSAPTITIAKGSNITEGENAEFTVTANPAPTTAINVTIQITVTGSYGVIPETRTIAIGTNGTATLTIATTNDSLDEIDGTVTATIVKTSSYSVDYTAHSATINIADNDLTPADAVILTIAPQTFTEGAGLLGVYHYLTVTLNKASTRLITVHWELQPTGTGARHATPGIDYNDRPRILYIRPGTTTKQIPIHIYDDNHNEPNETLQIVLTNLKNTHIINNKTLITIQDND